MMAAEPSQGGTWSIPGMTAAPGSQGGAGDIRADARVAVGVTTEALRRQHGRALAAERSEAAYNRAKRVTDPTGKARGQRGRVSGRAQRGRIQPSAASYRPDQGQQGTDAG